VQALPPRFSPGAPTLPLTPSNGLPLTGLSPQCRAISTVGLDQLLKIMIVLDIVDILSVDLRCKPVAALRASFRARDYCRDVRPYVYAVGEMALVA
jgi:hypothetical protein